MQLWLCILSDTQVAKSICVCYSMLGLVVCVPMMEAKRMDILSSYMSSEEEQISISRSNIRASNYEKNFCICGHIPEVPSCCMFTHTVSDMCPFQFLVHSDAYTTYYYYSVYI